MAGIQDALRAYAAGSILITIYVLHSRLGVFSYTSLSLLIRAKEDRLLHFVVGNFLSVLMVLVSLYFVKVCLMGHIKESERDTLFDNGQALVMDCVLFTLLANSHLRGAPLGFLMTWTMMVLCICVAATRIAMLGRVNGLASMGSGSELKHQSIRLYIGFVIHVTFDMVAMMTVLGYLRANTDPQTFRNSSYNAKHILKTWGLVVKPRAGFSSLLTIQTFWNIWDAVGWTICYFLPRGVRESWVMIVDPANSAACYLVFVLLNNGFHAFLGLFQTALPHWNASMLRHSQSQLREFHLIGLYLICLTDIVHAAVVVVYWISLLKNFTRMMNIILVSMGILFSSINQVVESTQNLLRSLNHREVMKDLAEASLEDCKRQETCIICTEDLKDKADVRVLNCRHCFHLDCIRGWYAHNAHCPVCRADIATVRTVPTESTFASPRNIKHVIVKLKTDKEKEKTDQILGEKYTLEVLSLNRFVRLADELKDETEELQQTRRSREPKLRSLLAELEATENLLQQASVSLTDLFPHLSERRTQQLV